MATLPGGGPAEDGSELRSHACGVAKVEARGVARRADGLHLTLPALPSQAVTLLYLCRHPRLYLFSTD